MESNDREIARRSLDLQARARDFRMMDLPGFMDWSERKLAEGECPSLIANLDATRMWMLPEDFGKITGFDFEEMLKELKTEIEKSTNKNK